MSGSTLKVFGALAFSVLIFGCHRNSSELAHLDPPAPRLDEPANASVADEARKANSTESDIHVRSDSEPSAGTSPFFFYERGEGHRISTRNVLDWHAEGLSDEAILSRIESSISVLPMTAADENRLRDAGISEYIIRIMKSSARRAR